MEEKKQLQEDEYCFPYHYVGQYVNGFKQTLNDTWGINYVATLEFLFQKISAYKINSIIDIGCGDGRFTKELQFRFPDADIIGVDYSQKAINLARAMNPKGNYQCIDITKIQPTKKYDLAVLMEVLEHIPPKEEKKFISAISKMLNKNGVLLITVPHDNKPVEYKHYRHFDSISIRRSLELNFNILEIIPFEKMSFKKNIIDYLLTNKYFLLNHQGLLNRIYAYYKEYLFFAGNETKCKRLFIRAQLLK